MRRLTTLGVLVLGLVACGSDVGPLAQPETTTSVEGSTTTTMEEPGLETVPRSGDDLLALAKAARMDLADSIGVPEDEIAVTSAATVTWNDGSLGCPQPGMSYTQALVEGARVTLMHNGTEYAYHHSGGELFLCEEPAEDTFVVSRDYSGELEMVPPPGFDK